jgi:hypothetical protein
MALSDAGLLALIEEALGTGDPKKPKLAPADATAVARNDGAMKPMSVPDAAGIDTTALKNRVADAEAIKTPYPLFWRDSSDFAQQAKREAEDKSVAAQVDSLNAARSILKMLSVASKQSGQRKVP